MNSSRRLLSWRRKNKDYAESTSKVIEQLTLLSVQKDDQLQNITTDMSTLNQSFNMAADDLLPSGKTKKESKKEKKLAKQIEEMDSKIIDLQKQLRDTNSEVKYYKRKEAKWVESEQDFIKRIYILEEFVIRSHSVINRRAARHMKTLKKSMNLDMKIFDTLMQKQEWSLKLEENKKQLTNSIKELEDFSKSLGGLNNMEIEHLKSKINEDTREEKEEKEKEEIEEKEEYNTRSMSMYSPDTLTRGESQNDQLNNTLDLGEPYNINGSPSKNRGGSPARSENPDFEDYLKRLG